VESPRDVITGVASGSFSSVPVGFGFRVLSMGGGGQSSQPRFRNAMTSWNFALVSMTCSLHRERIYLY